MKDPTKLLVAVGYLVISLIVGFIAVELGLMLGNKVKPNPQQT